MKYAGILIPLAALGLAIFLFLGTSPQDYYLDGLGNRRSAMEELLKIQSDQSLTPEGLFTVNTRIISLLKATGQTDKVNLFCTTYASKHPKDPYLAYYLFEVAENYRVQKADSLSVHYYDRLLKNHPDLEFRGQSLHRQALDHLVQITKDPRNRLEYLEDLMNRFSDQDSLPRVQYYLGQVYEELGEWDKAMEAYTVFLSYPGTPIPGDPQAWKNTREHVDFFRSTKSWVRPTLDSLLTGLQNAFSTKNLTAIESLRSKRGFLVGTWSNAESRSRAEQDNRAFVATQVRMGNIKLAEKIHPDSTDREVYLRSTGWSYIQDPVFYLYLKKVDFPPDPEVNGSWEWAGLIMGEKL